MNAKTKIYRHKFSPKFLEYLREFSRIHRFDTAGAFKDNWEIWCDENKDIIEEERTKLKEQGYDGKVLVKMYKSARYYFKNKSTAQKEHKKRRKYVTIDKAFLAGADKVSINSVLYKNPKIVKQITNIYGSQAVSANLEVIEQNEKFLLFSEF